MKIKKNKAIVINKRWALLCPLCNDIKAVADTFTELPDFVICDCDFNENKLPVYETYFCNNVKMIRRNKYPKFYGVVSHESSVLDVVWIDLHSLEESEKALHKAVEFLQKKQKYDT